MAVAESCVMRFLLQKCRPERAFGWRGQAALTCHRAFARDSFLAPCQRACTQNLKPEMVQMHYPRVTTRLFKATTHAAPSTRRARHDWRPWSCQKYSRSDF